MFETEPESNTVDKLFRLSRRVVRCNVPRPLLVGFHSHDIKEKVVSKLKNLKEAEERFKGISLAHDITPWQRTEIKRLVEQAKQNHASTSSDGAENYWFQVVGLGTKDEGGQSKEAKSGDPSKLKKSYHNLKNGFKCLCLNVRSLCNKMHELITAVEASTPDVIGISQTSGVTVASPEFCSRRGEGHGRVAHGFRSSW